MLYLTHLVFAHLTCFCTSYLSCTSCFALFFILLHILLFISFFYLYIYIYICSCVVLLLYNFYSLHCPLSGPDLIYISLLIIPCIIYHVTNKETLTFSYKCILCEFETYFQRKPSRPFPKSCNMSLEQTNGKIHIYILYVYVSNQIQQNKMQPEHVSEAERFNIPLCVCALRSVVHGQSKRSANDPLTFTGKPNPAQITRSH